MGEVGPAAVMHQPRNWRDAEPAQLGQPLVGKAPVVVTRDRRGGPLPEQRISQRRYSERGDARQVVASRVMPRTFQLIESPRPDTIDRAFDAAPELHADIRSRSSRGRRQKL